MTEKRQPGWTLRVRFGPVRNAPDPAHHVLVDLDTESQPDVRGNVRTAPSPIALFHGHDCVEQILAGSLGARPATALWRKQHPVFWLPKPVVEPHQRGRPENGGGAENAYPADEKSTPTGKDTIGSAQVGSALTATIENEQLMLPESTRRRRNQDLPVAPAGQL